MRTALFLSCFLLMSALVWAQGMSIQPTPAPGSAAGSQSAIDVVLNALLQVRDNPFAILAILLIVIVFVVVPLVIPPTQTIPPTTRLTVLIIVCIMFLVLIGFALKTTESKVNLESSQKATAQIQAVQKSANSWANQLNAEITTASVTRQPVAQVARELQESLQNSHCSGPTSKTFPVAATPGWRIVPGSIKVVELFRTGDSIAQGPIFSDPNHPDAGFNVILHAGNTGACGPKIFGQRVGLDARGSIGVAIRYNEERAQ
jgi:hypothetical protein